MPTTPRRTKRNAGYFLRVFRAERNLQQGDLATLFGINKSHISLIEAGKRNASPHVAELMAKATGAPMDVFLFATEGRTA
jgi:transcriptional regulator with XRE-family HTH domain